MKNNNIKLTKEDKKTILKAFNESDIRGLLYLKELIFVLRPPRETFKIDVYDILDFAINLNQMVVYGETYEGVCANNYSKIRDLYDIIILELFQMCDINFEEMGEI